MKKSIILHISGKDVVVFEKIEIKRLLYYKITSQIRASLKYFLEKKKKKAKVNTEKCILHAYFRKSQKRRRIDRP